jgi:hypothetical protein
MADKVLINVRERPLSTDIMLLQALEQRTEADYRKYYHATQHGIGGSEFAATYPETLVGGLQLSVVDANTLQVLAGFACQDSASLAPVPGANDSTYRIGLMKTPTNIDIPVPGGVDFTWCILRAQVTEVTTVSEPRDIMNSFTGQFESVNVAKLKEWKLALSWQIGTVDAATAPAPAADYIPLYLVSVAFNGSVIATAVDLRPTAEKRMPAGRRQNWDSQPISQILVRSTPGLIQPIVEQLNVTEAITSQDSSGGNTGGLMMRMLPRVSAQSPISFLDFVCPGSVVAAGSWLYAYMTPWYGLAPSGYVSQYDVSGIFCISSVPPRDGYNSLSITPPGAWAGYTVIAGVAPCVAVMRRDPDNGASAGNFGWVSMHGRNGVYRFFNDNQKSNRLIYDTTPAPTKLLNLTASHIPDCFTTVKLKILVNMAPTSGTNLGVSLYYAGEEAFAPIDYSILSAPANVGVTSFECTLQAIWKPGTTLVVGVGSAVNIQTVEVLLMEAAV